MPAPLVRLPVAAIVAVAGIAIVVLLATLVASGASDPFDRVVIAALRAPALDALLWPLRPLTELGSTVAVTLVAVLVFAFAAAIGPWRHGLAGALTILLASIGNSLLKVTMARERPDLLEPVIVEHGFSFPSGHSALGMVAYGIAAVLVSRSRLPRRARTVLVAILGAVVGLICLSRIWLGVHYPTDVLAGWVAGGVVVVLFAALTRRVSPAPAEGAVDADPAARRSDRPAPG
jgi:undecaprenyl-diphosphatase